MDKREVTVVSDVYFNVSMNIIEEITYSYKSIIYLGRARSGLSLYYKGQALVICTLQWPSNIVEWMS